MHLKKAEEAQPMRNVKKKMLTVIITLLSRSAHKCRFWPVTCFLSTGRGCSQLSPVMGGLRGMQTQAPPQSNKGGHFARQRGPRQKNFLGYMPFISFSSLPLSFLLCFLLYLNKPQNSGLPRRRCQGSWESSWELMRKQANPLLFHPIHSIFPN